MSTLRKAFAAACLTLTFSPLPGFCQSPPDMRFGFGSPVTKGELSKYFAIPPSGKGLPAGSGTADKGRVIFENECAMCHGDKLQGNQSPGLGGDRLIGGRGSLTSINPIKTTESYWPYATTLFDYIKRAMPFVAPGSLTDDQVYSVVAFILSEGHVISPNTVIDAKSLPLVKMPNRDNFVPDPRPEIELYK